MSRIYSLSALTVMELAPPDMVTCARDAGYSHVGLRIVPATTTEPNWDTVGDTPTIRETLARLRDTGITVLDIEVLRLTPEFRIADFEKVFATGAALGARNALVADSDPDVARFVDHYGALCDLAARYGIAPSVEPMPWTEAKNFAQAVALVTAAARGNSGVVIDPLHFDRGGSEADEIAPVPREYIRYLQMCDAPAERPTEVAELLRQARTDRLLPGEGAIDLVGILRNVPADTPISMEVPQAALVASVPAVERARRALVATRRLVERAGLPA